MQLCPVCEGQARVTAQLDAAYIRSRLEQELGESPPREIAIADYELRQCARCELVFADPMQAGDSPYYQWVTSFDHYHAGHRWEWGVVRRILAGRGPMRLLELGCGNGSFLASVASLKNVDARGIDLSQADVLRARAGGLNARCISVEDTVNEAAAEDARFDAIFMSHVLEHVEDPLSTVLGCKRLLTPGGEIIFSVPYSPTSREYLKPDIMNLPPHHLTRWNIASLTRLAEVAGLQLSYEMRNPKSVLKRAIHHTVETATGRANGVSALETMGIVLLRPRTLAGALKLYRSREKVGGRRAADEILVRLKT